MRRFLSEQITKICAFWSYLKKLIMRNPKRDGSVSSAGSSGPQKIRWVVTFDKVLEPEDDASIDKQFLSCTKEGDGRCISARRIKGNSALVELWEFEGPEVDIRTHKQKITAGVSSTGTHSDLDFEIDFKEHFPEGLNFDDFTFPAFSHNGKGEQPLLIAVLDTGVDTSVIPPQYLWHDKESGRPGRSFIKNDGEIEDDDKDRHGTMVTSLILEQFRHFKDYPVQIMNLKTHDANGKGDLFAIMDAICFAKKNGADIINASWGFYHDEDIVNSYLKDLITKTLLDEGILFVTVAGNKIPGSGPYFFPATFGKGIPDEQKNLLVVTSLNDTLEKVSKNHNSSPEWVDFGVPADFNQAIGDAEYYTYKLPLKRKPPYVDPKPDDYLAVSGTSFATAIATGRIATFVKVRKGNKKEMIEDIGDALFGLSPALEEAIIGGRYLKRTSIPLTTTSMS